MTYKIVNVENDNKLDGTAIGVGYPFTKPGVFGHTFTTVDKAISNLKCLLLTRKGERALQPELGTDLLYLIFQPNVSELKDDIINIISEPVAYWLPYISLTEVLVTTVEDEPTMPHHVKIVIGFTIAGMVDNTKITIFANENGTLTIDNQTNAFGKIKTT